MISDFHELSDKIDRLAGVTESLRRENAQLRQANALLSAENLAFMNRLGEAQRRLEALLEKLPAPAPAPASAPASVAAHPDAAGSAIHHTEAAQ